MGDCFNLRHLREALAALPKTLDDTYARILRSIDETYGHYHRYILKLLQWLTFSARPLRLEELAETIAIDVDETPRFDPGRRWPDPRDLLRICSSLITLTANAYDSKEYDSEVEESGSEYGESGSDLSEGSQIPDADSVSKFIRLAHFSVKEYLVSKRIQHGIAAHYSIREIESHGVIAEDCIAYLLQFNEPSLTPKALKKAPLARYAAEYWVDHTREAAKGPVDPTISLSMELLTSHGGGLLNWIRICDPDNYGVQNLSHELYKVAPPLYYASQAGLLAQVNLLIKSNMDVNAQGGVQGNALQVASSQGHEDVSQILLDNGADINARSGFFGTALIAACNHGSENLVRILLDNGADANVKRDFNAMDNETMYDALQLASEHGYENVVKMLLDNGADANVKRNGSIGTALQLAVIQG